MSRRVGEHDALAATDASRRSGSAPWLSVDGLLPSLGGLSLHGQEEDTGPLLTGKSEIHKKKPPPHRSVVKPADLLAAAEVLAEQRRVLNFTPSDKIGHLGLNLTDATNPLVRTGDRRDKREKLVPNQTYDLERSNRGLSNGIVKEDYATVLFITGGQYQHDNIRHYILSSNTEHWREDMPDIEYQFAGSKSFTQSPYAKEMRTHFYQLKKASSVYTIANDGIKSEQAFTRMYVFVKQQTHDQESPYGTYKYLGRFEVVSKGNTGADVLTLKEFKP